MINSYIGWRKHHPSYAVPEYPSTLRAKERRAIDQVMPYITLCDFHDALIHRNTDAYAAINKKDLGQVQQLLEKHFARQKDGIEILLRL